MTQPLAENPAVQRPARTLTAMQQDALVSIDFFRSQSRDRRGWRIGNKKFAPGVICALERHGLVRVGMRDVSVTPAGKVAIERLKDPS